MPCHCQDSHDLKTLLVEASHRVRLADILDRCLVKDLVQANLSESLRNSHQEKSENDEGNIHHVN